MEQNRNEMWRLLVEKLMLNISYAYQTSQIDREKLHKLEWEHDENELSILGEVEIRSEAVAGIAERYISIGIQKKEIGNLKDILKKMSIYYSSVLLEWLLKNSDNYNAFTSYIHSIEHLRMFLSEIISSQEEK